MRSSTNRCRSGGASSSSGRAPIGKMENDRPAGRLLVVGEIPVELDDAVEAAQEHLTQRDTACRPVPRDRAGIAAGFDRQQVLHLLAQKSEALVADAAGRREDVEQIGWQALMERNTAFGADVDAGALQPIGGRAVPLVKRDTDARLLEPLREGEAADEIGRASCRERV